MSVRRMVEGTQVISHERQEMVEGTQVMVR